MTYTEKLRDPRWQKRRLEVLKRDKFTCKYCNDTTQTLRVHHFSYRPGTNPWDYDDGDMITLCENCHAFEHISDLHPVISEFHTYITINPKKYGAVVKRLVGIALNYYKP